MSTSQHGTINGSPIVSTHCGQATGEAIYKTANGWRWTSDVKPWHHTTTGITVSQVKR